MVRGDSQQKLAGIMPVRLGPTIVLQPILQTDFRKIATLGTDAASRRHPCPARTTILQSREKDQAENLRGGSGCEAAFVRVAMGRPRSSARHSLAVRPRRRFRNLPTAKAPSAPARRNRFHMAPASVPLRYSAMTFFRSCFPLCAFCPRTAMSFNTISGKFGKKFCLGFFLARFQCCHFLSSFGKRAATAMECANALSNSLCSSTSTQCR